MKYSPASSCSVPLSSAKSDDLPAPLRPTSPTFSPGLRVTLAPSSSTLAPRRRVRFLRVIKQRLACQQQHLIFTGAGLEPDRFELWKSGFKVAAFVADFQHQHGVLVHLLRGAMHQATAWTLSAAWCMAPRNR